MMSDTERKELELAAGWNPPAEPGTVEALMAHHRAALIEAAQSARDVRRFEAAKMIEAVIADPSAVPAPPAGLVWRSEPPDRPGWWWIGHRREDGAVGGPRIEYLAESRLEWLRVYPDQGLAFAGPIPKPTDEPGPAPVPVGPDAALTAAALALRTGGERIAADLIESIRDLRLGNGVAISHLRSALVRYADATGGWPEPTEPTGGGER